MLKFSPMKLYGAMPFFFKEDFINESNAFTKYYEAIKKNGCISKIIEQVENMGDYCDLFNNVSGNYIKDPINLLCDPIPDEEENESILYAHQDLKLTNSSKGRCLVAEYGFPKAEYIIVEKPTVLQINPLCSCVGNPESSLYRCHNCGKACRKFFTCDGCNICIFCTRECLYEAYKNYHRYECYGIQRHFWSMDDTDYSYLSLRIMLYGARKKFETDPIGTCYGNKENNYPYIYKLESHFNKLSLLQINEILYSSVRNLVYLMKKTTFFNQYNKENYDLNDLYLYVGGLLVKHYSQAKNNCLHLVLYNLPAGFGLNVISGKGKAICPTIALLNHACSPNATIIVYEQYIVVKTLRRIKMGEEITVCYSEVDPLLPLLDRQVITEELLQFRCTCCFCEYERIWAEAPFKCEKCKTGRVKETDLKQGKCMGYCIKCKKYFSMKRILENVRMAKICRNLCWY